MLAAGVVTLRLHSRAGAGGRDRSDASLCRGILALLHDLGDEAIFNLHGRSVTPEQFLGIEIKFPRGRVLNC